MIFFGHSLGGIVIKSALTQAQGKPSQFGDILSSTKAIVFFGTPHQGADIADLAQVLGKVGRVVGLRNTLVTAELEKWSFPLVDLANLFGALAPQIEITTFFEKLPTRGVLVSLFYLWTVIEHD